MRDDQGNFEMLRRGLPALHPIAGGTVWVVAGLGEAGPAFAEATARRPESAHSTRSGQATPATSLFPSGAKRVLPCDGYSITTGPGAPRYGSVADR